MYMLPSWSERGVKHALVTQATIDEATLPELFPSPLPEEKPEEEDQAATG